MTQSLNRRLLPRSNPYELVVVSGVVLVKLPDFIFCDHVMPSLALVVVWPLELVMLVTISTYVTPSNVQLLKTAFIPLGMRTFLKCMLLKIGRWYVACQDCEP